MFIRLDVKPEIEILKVIYIEQSKGDPEDLNPSELHESKLRSNVAVNLHHLSRERFQNLLLVNRAHF